MDRGKITKELLDYYKALPEYKALQDFDKWEDDVLTDFIRVAIEAEYYEVCQIIHAIRKKRAQEKNNQFSN